MHVYAVPVTQLVRCYYREGRTVPSASLMYISLTGSRGFFCVKTKPSRAPPGIVAHLTLVGKVGVFALCLSTLSRQALLRNKNKI